MYEKHFSLKYKPFELVPNPDFLYLSGTHKRAIIYLDYGIKEKIGFILLTGEIGSGKTTIIRNFIKNMNGSVKLSKVNNTKVSKELLLSMINEDFGIDVKGKTKDRLLSDLNEFLIEQYARKIQPVLLIDEAQNLTPSMLEEIRLLSNLETNTAKLIQIILVGQPELIKTIMLPELSQLRQRIQIKYHISPMTKGETMQYVKHRLRIAGNADAINVNEDTILHIFNFSKGIPRLINILCDFALLTAFTEKNAQVSTEIIREVADDLESRNYLAVPHGANVPFPESSDADPRNVKTVEAFESRLNQLEERVKELTEKFSAVNKFGDEKKSSLLIEHFEEQLICRTLKKFTEENKINELFERISELEKISVLFDTEKIKYHMGTKIEECFRNGSYPISKARNELVERVSELEKISVLFDTEKIKYHMGTKIEECFRNGSYPISKARVDELVKNFFCALNETMSDLKK